MTVGVYRELVKQNHFMLWKNHQNAAVNIVLDISERSRCD